jgi:flagellar protein FliO/FliZ
MMSFRLLGLIISAMPAVLLAAPTQTDSASKLATNPAGTGVVLEIAAVLAGVVILIIGLGWLMKRVGHFPTAGKGMVRILGGVSLGPRERAVVIEAGSKRLLVGVAPGRVQTLCVLGEADTQNDISTEDVSEEFSTQLDAQLQDESR